MSRKHAKKLTKLPDGYAITSEDGYICVRFMTARLLRDFTEADSVVSAWAKKNKLKVIGSGTDLVSHVRDWAFERQ